MAIQKKSGWLTARVGDELVMMNAQKGDYIGLSEVGARIWKLLDSQSEMESICAQLQKDYNVAPDICRNEVESFLKELVKHGAVAFDPPSLA